MECWHMSGAGNDFLVIDARGQSLDFSAMAAKLCAQYGVDGFLAVDRSAIADFKLHFYNPDGSRGEMCGNGSRCICRYAYDNGIAGENMVIETDAGLVVGQRLGENRYLVHLNPPSILDLERLPGVAYLELGDPGLPHAVTECPVLTWEDKPRLLEKAIALRYDPAFPKGVNVDFYTRLSDTRVRILTYERGVEAYTLACGTGCGSVAAVLHTCGQLPGGKLTLENQGGTLEITIGHADGKINSLLLEGPADILKILEI